MAKHGDSVPTTKALKNLAVLVGEGTVTAGRRAAVVTATSGMVLTGGVVVTATTANAAEATEMPSVDAPPEAAPPVENAYQYGATQSQVSRDVSAPSSAPVSFDSNAVSAKSEIKQDKAAVAPSESNSSKNEQQKPVAANQAPAPVAPVQSTTPAQNALPAPETRTVTTRTTTTQNTVPSQQQTQGQRTTTTTQQPSTTESSFSQQQSGTDASKIAAAAYQQLGVKQDCTNLVTNALAAAGIKFRGWPADYQRLGQKVSAAQAKPGDLVYYANNGMGGQHIAVYVGNGMAVHGGWTGNNTVVASVNLPSGPPTAYISLSGAAQPQAAPAPQAQPAAAPVRQAQPAPAPVPQPAPKPVAAPAPAPAAAPQGSGKQAIVDAAYRGVGKPYVWGGSTPNGWDCSGFTMWAYAQAGLKIPRVNPHTAMRQTNSPQPGDIIMRRGGGHISIYVGNGMEIGALNPSDGTKLMSVAMLDKYMGKGTFFTL